MGKKTTRAGKLNQIRRNDPCFCGAKRPSGKPKRYKDCCWLKKDEIIAAAQQALDRQDKEKLDLAKLGIYINYVNPCTYVNPNTKQEMRAWALGSRLFHSRPAHETFHEFIISHLRDELGPSWWYEQSQLEEPHFLFKCFTQFSEWKKRNAEIEDNRVDNNTFYALTDGWSKTLASLAFDVCSLEHKKQLPVHLMNRLRNKEAYQGAHYEIAVAAIFSRLDCDIEFLDEEKRTDKHCEFFATHKPTNTLIAVEAKSRHRAGVKNTIGTLNQKKLLKGDVQQLFNKALKQNPKDKPFFVFIDVNSPLTPNVPLPEKQWFKDIKKMMDTYGAPTPDKPDEFTAAVFTNFSPHFQEDQQSSANEYFGIYPLHQMFPISDGRFLNMLNTAVQHYGNVPNISEHK